MKTWEQILEDVGMMVLPFLPGGWGAIAPTVISGIATAKAMIGATNAQKLSSVVSLVGDAAIAANTGAGHVVVDPVQLQATAATVISGVVQTVNFIHNPSSGQAVASGVPVQAPSTLGVSATPASAVLTA